MPELPKALPTALTVGELHNLLWEQSLASICRKLECDAAWLKQFCSYASIPLPPPTYWKSKRAGKRVHRRWLPKNLDRRGKVTTLLEKRGHGESAVPVVVAEQDVTDLISEISRLEVRVAPSDSTERLHPVVAASRRVMQRHARDEWPSRFNRIRRREPNQKPVFLVEVGREMVGRATQLLQALVNAVVNLGGAIETSGGDVAAVKLLGELHRFRLRERLQRHRETSQEEAQPSESWRPTGVLELHLEEWLGGELLKKWSDENGEIETRLPAILVDFVKQVQSTRTKNEALRQAKEQKLREQDARRRAAEAAERNRHRPAILLELAERHQAAIAIRVFLHACRSDGPLPADVESWISSAEAAVQALSPLAHGVASLRDRVEKAVDEKMRGWYYHDWSH